MQLPTQHLVGGCFYLFVGMYLSEKSISGAEERGKMTCVLLHSIVKLGRTEKSLEMPGKNGYDNRQENLQRRENGGTGTEALYGLYGTG